MRIAVFAPAIAVPPHRARNVSGHAQVPLEAARRLQAAGHDVVVLASRNSSDHVLPAFAAHDLDVRFIADAKSRGAIGHQAGARLRPLGLVHHLQQMRTALLSSDRQVLHAFGYEGTAKLVATATALGIQPVPAVVTALGPVRDRRFLAAYRRIGGWATATEHVAESLRAMGLDVTLLRHGVVRDLLTEAPSPFDRVRRRVLFWREASLDAGADLVVEAFRRLAPLHPDVAFTFALRENRAEVPGVAALAEQHPNVEVHRHPYGPGVGLADLVAESIVAVLPFRRLSIHPQFALLETVASGSPVVTTDVGSAGEVIRHGREGLVVAGDDASALVEALDRVLRRDVVLPAGRELAADVAARWNWDGWAQAADRLHHDAVG